MRNNKGFTLAEIAVVVIIVGVLASLALPRYTAMVEKAHCAEALLVLGHLREAQMVYKLEHGTYVPETWATYVPELRYDPPNLEFFEPTSAKVYNCFFGPPYCIVAEIYRKDWSYHLHIQEDGQIDCSREWSTRGSDFCRRLGFKDEYW